MSTTFNEFALSAMAYPNGRIAVLLVLYPRLTKEKRDELLLFIKRASPDEMRNLRSIPALGNKLDQLMRDHPDHSPPRAHHALWIAAAVTIGLSALWLW